jgi:hypothetical protein
MTDQIKKSVKTLVEKFGVFEIESDLLQYIETGKRSENLESKMLIDPLCRKAMDTILEAELLTIKHIAESRKAT